LKYRVRGRRISETVRTVETIYRNNNYSVTSKAISKSKNEP
jgi:hypothetical protein